MDPNTRALIMGAAGAGGAEKLYVEDVFSTWLYAGSSSSQTITNGIDLSGKGGLVWLKVRDNTYSHALFDSQQSWNGWLVPNNTNANADPSTQYVSPGSSGFTINSGGLIFNNSGFNFTSWTFRKAAKFFDVVTYVGNGASNRDISHSLGSTPGCVIVKATSASGDWAVWHRNNGSAAANYFNLNGTNAAFVNASNNGFATSSVIKIGAGEIAPQIGNVNNNGVSYVAYVFAHDAGGFGDAGADNAISCGNYTGNGSTAGPTVTLGWEPQWLLIRRTDSANDWNLIDNMRGFVVGGTDAELNPNLNSAESSGTFVTPLATGFQLNTTDAGYNASSGNYIYIAIRRGPMKTPTDATKVFASIAATNSNGTTRTTGFPVDLQFRTAREVLSSRRFYTRLLGVSVDSAGTGSELYTDSISAESTGVSTTYSWWNTGYTENNTLTTRSVIAHNFRRAPGFFDAVAYTGTGSARTVSHNLGVAPELMIVKRRESDFWMVYTAALGNTKALNLNNASAPTTLISIWNNTSPTSTVFTVGTATDVNASGGTYIAYLFATLTAISKVGSYTGTGTTQQINCGFTAGARFVLIKRTDSTGDWYVWDTARGIISGNDPYLLLNSTAAEVTSTDYIDPLNSGFEISSTAPAAINANGGSFIYLAIA